MLTVNPEFAVLNFQINDAIKAMPEIAKIVEDNTHGQVSGYVRTTKELPRIQAAMERKGWAFSGSGYFSAVFIKGSVAIKIGLKKEDSGAMYAAWCRANQGKPGVPNVYAIQHYGPCYISVTDRLFPLDLSDPYTLCEFKDVEAVFHYPAEATDAFAVTKTAREIREFFAGVASFDLSIRNVMQDEGGNLVITDPVSYSASNDDGYTYTTTQSPTMEAA